MLILYSHQSGNYLQQPQPYKCLHPASHRTEHEHAQKLSLHPPGVVFSQNPMPALLCHTLPDIPACGSLFPPGYYAAVPFPFHSIRAKIQPKLSPKSKYIQNPLRKQAAQKQQDAICPLPQ